MSNALKLSTALPGDDEINGLDVLVPEGTFRSTCLRCGWIEYHPIEDLDEQMERAGLGKGEPDADELPGVRTGDEPEVWVYGDDEPSAEVVQIDGRR